MPTSTNERTTTPVRRRRKIELILAVAAIALALVVTALVLFSALDVDAPPQAPSSEPTVTEETQATTEAPTEPTLPPPESNPYGPLDFVYRDGYLTCTAGESVLGIDISEFQTVTDWNAVKEAGVEFVIIRVGYRTYSSGELYLDDLAQQHYREAREAGLKVGAYFFSQAITTQEATDEAVMLLDAIRDWEVEMPVVFDWEYMGDSSRASHLTREELTDCTRIFCELVEAKGYQPVFYFNQNQARDLLNLSELKNFGFWLAMYTERMTYPYRLQLWQYSCTGQVPGIEGDVDLDLYFPPEGSSGEYT